MKYGQQSFLKLDTEIISKLITKYLILVNIHKMQIIRALIVIQTFNG